MKIYLQVQEDSFLSSWGFSKGNETEIEINVPIGHEMLQNPPSFRYYRLANGELIKDESKQQQLIQERVERQNQPNNEKKLALLQKAVDDLILGVML